LAGEYTKLSISRQIDINLGGCDAQILESAVEDGGKNAVVII
jgi:hypothetical protein